MWSDSEAYAKYDFPDIRYEGALWLMNLLHNTTLPVWTIFTPEQKNIGNLVGIMALYYALTTMYSEKKIKH